MDRHPGRRRRRAALAALALAVAGGAGASGLLFDDFDSLDGWTVREAAGHPGLPGARWSAAALAVVDDPERRGNRLLRLAARTDGTPAGTMQAQLCQQRKFLRGTYAARLRFSDAPLAGADGDPVVMAFYAISPLAHDLDPSFSEVDFEYLPNGGWGSPRTRLYGISWQTVQIEPWRAFNQAAEAFGSHAGWQLLTMQVGEHETQHHVGERLLARHGGRNVPAVPMAIQFSLWFSPGGLLPPNAGVREYAFDVDWVLHVPGRQLSPAAVLAEVDALRRRGVSRLDSVAPAEPPLASPCNL